MKLPLLNKKIIFKTAFCLSFIFIQACDKKDDQALATRFEIAFDTETIDFAMVDSVTASFSRAGQTPNFTKTFHRGTGTGKFYLEEQELKDGAWFATINVYSRHDQGSRRKYQLKKQIENLHMTIKAPVIKAGNDWNSFVIVSNKNYNITLVFPERQDNSIFELAIPDDKTWDYIYLERFSYTANGNLVDAVDWEAKGKVAGRINNSTVLFDYTERLKTKSWNDTETLITLKNTITGEECFLYYSYTNRYQ